MKLIYSLAILTLFILSGCHQTEHQTKEESVFTVSYPIKKDTVLYKDYVCQIRSYQRIELRALEKGYLQKIYVDEGQSVKAGDLLFQIMPVIYQAEMQKAEAEVNFATIEYQNTKNLADNNVVSKNELALAQSKLEKAKAEMAMAKAHLTFTEIHAPFDGIVGLFNEMRLGSLIDEGDLLTTLSDNSKMWVYFYLPEAEYLEYASKPKTEMLTNVKLELANKQLFSELGKIETFAADFNNETGTIAFRATFENPKGLLRNGETGNILLPILLKDAIMIPQKSTYEVLDRKYVYVVNDSNVIQSREIKVNVEIPHIYVVEDGLELTDKILVDGLRKVKNNQKILTKTAGLTNILAEMHNLHAE
jgi:membrane fusion protein, multidrug efflux system